MCMLKEQSQCVLRNLYVRGDTHGEQGAFLHLKDEHLDQLKKGDKLFITGDFGFCFMNDIYERKFLEYMAELPFTILFTDGNHENFDILNSLPVEEYCGGKVHILARNSEDEPKVIHLMRGQVYEIDEKKIFTFGGGYSRDRWMRTEGVTWWPQEMPTDEEKVEAINNLKKYDNKVDYIITHTCPENIMMLSYPKHEEEKPLNNFLQWVKDNVQYKHWYFGHLHVEREYLDNISCCMFRLRNMDDNTFLDEVEEDV